MKNNTLWGLVAGAAFLTVTSSHAEIALVYSNGDLDRRDYAASYLGEEISAKIDEGIAMQAGSISGPGTLLKTGEGHLLLSGANIYSEGTLVEAGVLEVCGPTASILHPDADLTVSGGGAALLVTAGAQFEGVSASLGASGKGIASATVYNGYYSDGQFTASRWTVENLRVGSSGNAAFTVLDGAIVSTKTTSIGKTSSATVSGGTLVGDVLHNSSWRNAGAFEVDGALTVASGASLETKAVVVGGRKGVLNIGSYDRPTDAGHLIADEVQLQTRDSTINFNQMDELSFASQISGRGQVVQRGYGTTVLGQNGYSGGTEIRGGVLRAGDDFAFGSGKVEIDGGVLDSAGHFLGNDVLMTSGVVRGSGVLGKVSIEGGEFAPGRLSTEDLKLGGDSFTNISIGLESSHVFVDGNISFGGTLQLTLTEGFIPVHGMQFDVFDWTGRARGVFSEFDLPVLRDGNSWDLSRLYVDGTIQVAPEPSTWMLIIASGAMLYFLRARR